MCFNFRVLPRSLFIRRKLGCICARPTQRRLSYPLLLNNYLSSTIVPSPSSAPSALSDTVVLYRWPTMRHFSFISRLKVYQVTIMLLLLPPMGYMYLHGDITTKTMSYATVATLGTTGVLFILSHYFRRVVGEMTFVQSSNQLRLSTLTFAGRRRNLKFDVEDIIPFLDSQLRMGGAIQRLELRNHSEVFLYSLKYGHILDFALLQKLLKL